MNFRDIIFHTLSRWAHRIRSAPSSRVSAVPVHPGIYLYFDEAGDLDFGTTGSRYYLGGVLLLPDPWDLTRALNDTREEGLQELPGKYRGKSEV